MDKQKPYAIIRIKGKQYKVSEGEELFVDYLADAKPTADALLIVKEGEVFLGKPILKENSIKLKTLEEKVLGEKVHIFKYKAKSRYRKRFGFRPKYTKILVEKIG